VQIGLVLWSELDIIIIIIIIIVVVVVMTKTVASTAEGNADYYFLHV